MKIQDLARTAVSVPPETSVLEAIRVMQQHRVSSVAVTREGWMDGIFTLRDVARKVVLENLDPRTTPLEGVMSRDIVWAFGSTEVREALKLMLERGIHHLPIVDDEGKLQGIVSFQYLLRDKIDALEFQVGTLDQFIRNNGYS